MVDIHSHILNNILDSPVSVDESLIMAKQYVRCGFTHVVSTPHYNPVEESIDNFLDKCGYLYYNLDQHLLKQQINLKVIHGAEVMLYPELIQMSNINRLCIGKTSYMLVELPWNQIPPWTQDVLFQLALQNISPILAHPERNSEIYKNFDLFLKLIEAGLQTQINAINVFHSGFVKKIIHMLFIENAVSYIATDCHLAGRRIQKFNDALRILKRRYGKFQLECILQNSMSLLSNIDLTD